MAIKKIIIQIDMPEGNEVTENSEEINTLIEIIQDLLSGDYKLTFINSNNKLSSISTVGYEALMQYDTADKYLINDFNNRFCEGKEIYKNLPKYAKDRLQKMNNSLFINVKGNNKIVSSLIDSKIEGYINALLDDKKISFYEAVRLKFYVVNTYLIKLKYEK